MERESFLLIENSKYMHTSGQSNLIRLMKTVDFSLFRAYVKGLVFWPSTFVNDFSTGSSFDFFLAELYIGLTSLSYYYQSKTKIFF